MCSLPRQQGGNLRLSSGSTIWLEGISLEKLIVGNLIFPISFSKQIISFSGLTAVITPGAEVPEPAVNKRFNTEFSVN